MQAMAEIVVNGASIECPLGKPGKAALVVAPSSMVSAGKQPVATTMDFAPMKNIPTFGMCTSPSNPQVSAAQGAPQPCVPVITDPWKPGSPTVKVGNLSALTSSSMCMCKWGGVITIKDAGQPTTSTG